MDRNVDIHVFKLLCGCFLVLCNAVPLNNKMNATSEMLRDFSEQLIIPRVHLDEPDETLMEWAKENIDEHPERTAQVIEELRDLIFERGECVPVRMDDVFLLRFLRARNFITKLSHRLLVNYTELWETAPQFFDIDYGKIMRLSDEKIFSVPPYYDQDGRRLLIVRIGEWKPHMFSTDELFQMLIIILQVALMEPKFQILGGQCILDLTGISLGHTWYFSPSIAKQILQIAFRSMPVRIKAVHIINTSWIFEKVFGIIKQFLTDFMQDVIYFHEDLDSLHRSIDPKYLPKRYGGVHSDYTFSSWIMSMKGNDKVISELESLGYDGCRDAIQNYEPNISTNGEDDGDGEL